MEVSFARNIRITRGRVSWFSFAVGASLALVAPDARAQSLDSKPAPVQSHRDSPRRARSVPVDRPELGADHKGDYAALEHGSTFEDGADFGTLEKRIRDLSAKVDELSDLLRRQKGSTEATHFAPRPFRALLINARHTPPGPGTYAEALEVLVRDRIRAISASFDDDARRSRLAIDPEPAERARLLEPIYRWVDAQTNPAEHAHAELCAFVYLSLLETRAATEVTEPMPALHKVLRDFRVDRASLAEHLERRFLTDGGMEGRDLPVVLRAVAAAYPDLRSVRDFLGWVALGIGADRRDDWEKKGPVAYHAEPESQFEAAAENAVVDDGDVLKLQIELQRMSVEAKALEPRSAHPETKTADWQGRLLHAERELDRLLRAADGEREAVMTLARRLPIAHKKVELAVPTVDLKTLERPGDELASDGLSTQH